MTGWFGFGAAITAASLAPSSTLGGFDETPLTESARDKELLSFREHFFSVNDALHLVCVLEVSCEDQEAAREIPRGAIDPRPRDTAVTVSRATSGELALDPRR